MRLQSKIVLNVLAIGFVFAVLLVFNAPATFAEDDSICNGRIFGTTEAGNVNAGRIHFNSHPGPGIEDNKVVDLSIVGLGEGLAPADRINAACAQETTAKSTVFKDKTYNLQGFAWNDNLGFVSFYCGADGKNSGVGCGNNPYGVKIEKADGAGIKKLTGYAWNAAFGYMQFSGNGAIPWTVTMDSSGKLSGYAWTEAGIWVNFAGAVIKLPGQQIDALVSGCSDKPFVCLEVVPKTGVVVANGNDGYELHLYLFDDDGVTPMDLSKYDLSNMKFYWKDTVKLTQMAGDTFSAGNSAIVGKPTTVKMSDFSAVAGDSGHYKYNGLVKSLAPTSNANISYTTFTKPSVSKKNEQFITPIFGGKKIEPNDLILKYFEFTLKTKVDGQTVVYKGSPVDKAYPNNKDGFALNFKPAIDLDTLYANDLQDAIALNRGIPVNFRLKVKRNGNISFSDEKLELFMDYNKEKQEKSIECSGGEFKGFSLGFINNFDGEKSGKSNLVSGITPSLLEGVDLQGIATIPESEDGDKDKASPCTRVEGPTLYSIVKYTVGGKAVSYYSNNLPRISSEINNPAAVVHGNVYAQKSFSPNSTVQAIQEINTKGTNSVRDSVYQQIVKTLGVKINANGKDATGSCIVSGLQGKISFNVSCDEGGKLTKNHMFGNERILYFENADVRINLNGYSGLNTIITSNSNVYIDSDIYNQKPSMDNRVAIVSLRPYSLGCGKGNVYIKNSVKNIQASIFSDCAIYSYYDGQKLLSDGRPEWSDFTEMVDKLGNQLLIAGSISAAVTYGGGDSDQFGYLRSPFGVVKIADIDTKKRMEIQQTDLNYLRLFKLEMELTDSGAPIDQSCGKALTFDEIVQIQQAKEDDSIDPVVGYGVDEFGDPRICNGYDSVNAFDPKNPTGSGDLVPPNDVSVLAKGLDHTKDFDPIYVFYVPPGSFVFRQ